MIRKMLVLPFLLIAFYLLQVNFRLYHRAVIVVDQYGEYSKDLYHQLRFLKQEMHTGAGMQMQTIYPEGYVFIHALYALSWANLVDELSVDSPIHQEALAEIRWSIDRLEGKTARAIFPAEMYLPYGIFYQGWLNYTRAAYLAALPTPATDSVQLERFQVSCSKIAESLERHHTPFLFSYHGGCWPADNVVALASLAAHDHLLEPQFTATREAWLERIRTKLDTNGLVPHSVDLTYGNALQTARGSSQSLMQAFWPQIDTAFARQQYAIYERKFQDSKFGLPGIREYTKGNFGFGDVDSGPVLLGIGGAASVVGMGSAARYADQALHTGLRNSIEGFAAAFCWRGRKRYLGGKIPMADAFIAWSHSRTPKALLVQSAFPKAKFHLISGLVLSFLFLLMVKIWPSQTSSK